MIRALTFADLEVGERFKLEGTTAVYVKATTFGARRADAGPSSQQPVEKTAKVTREESHATQ